MTRVAFSLTAGICSSRPVSIRYFVMEIPGAKFNMFCSPHPYGKRRRFSRPSRLGPRSSPERIHHMILRILNTALQLQLQQNTPRLSLELKLNHSLKTTPRESLLMLKICLPDIDSHARPESATISSGAEIAKLMCLALSVHRKYVDAKRCQHELNTPYQPRLTVLSLQCKCSMKAHEINETLESNIIEHLVSFPCTP